MYTHDKLGLNTRKALSNKRRLSGTVRGFHLGTHVVQTRNDFFKNKRLKQRDKGQ